MFEYLRYFFDPEHLLALYPTPLQPRAVMILAVIFGASIIAGIACKMYAAQVDAIYAKGWERMFKLGLVMGILGYVHLFFGWQGVTLLGSRFWLVVWFLIVVIWKVNILRYFRTTAPARRQEVDRKRQMEKYLPR